MSRMRLVLFSVLAVSVVGAVASASASAVMPAYSNGTTLFPNGVNLNVLGTNVGNPTLKGTLAGVKIEIVCTAEHATGTAQNSSTTGMGLGLVLSHYLECTVVKPAGQGCLVVNHLVHLSAHDLLLLGTNPGDYIVDFFPEGAHFTEFTFEKCTNAGLNTTFPVEGILAALVDNSTLNLLFTSTSGSRATFGGNPMEYLDTVKTTLAGGGLLQVENGS